MVPWFSLVAVAWGGPWPQTQLDAWVLQAAGADAAVADADWVPVSGIPGVTGVVVGRYTKDGASWGTMLTVYPHDGGPWISAGYGLGVVDAVRVVGVLGLGSEGRLPLRGPAPAGTAVDPVLVLVREATTDGTRRSEAVLVSLADPPRPVGVAAIPVGEDRAVVPPGAGGPPQISLGWRADALEVQRGDTERELVVVGHDRPTPEARCPGPDHVFRYRIARRRIDAVGMQYVEVPCK